MYAPEWHCCLIFLTRVLRRLKEESQEGDWFFWVAKSSSKDGQEGRQGNQRLMNTFKYIII